MKRIILISTFCISQLCFSHAQGVCGAPQELENHLKEYPMMRSFMTNYLQSLVNHIKNFPFNPDLHRSAVTIPIVVHVVYKNASENIADAVIQDEIKVLNDAFRYRDPKDATAIPAVFKGYADDTYIQFRLASRDPSGKLTTGITRKSTTKSIFYMDTEDAKTSANGVLNWDPKRYLNIWICDITATWLPAGSTLLGYSSFPWDTISRYDGVVMNFGCFGPGAVMTNYQMGKVLVHEVGHFMGLWHIFEGGCADGDEVADTPPQPQATNGNPTFPHVTCSNGPNGEMFMNHMNYVDDVAKHMFSKGQRVRMLANISPGGKRASLAVSDGLFPAKAVSRDYDVFLEPQNVNLPSWKAASLMTHSWACQCSPILENLLADNKGRRSNRYNSMGPEIADVIYALALTPEEMLACYTIEGFYDRLNKGPITILSIGANEYYGLVVSGMIIDQGKSRALLKIKDPMNIGPKGFFITNQQGSEYQVDYSEFMTEMLEKAVISNRHIYIVYPPSSI